MIERDRLKEKKKMIENKEKEVERLKKESRKRSRKIEESEYS